LEKNTLKVSVEDKISIDFINKFYLNELRMGRLLQNRENFSFRGGIVDVFSFRMIIHQVSFGDGERASVDFDVATQLSLEAKKSR
jgi:transcription-repair coupling factor (superfamily II helicase)